MPLEVAARGDAPNCRELAELHAEGIAKLALAHVELPLLSLAIGVLGREERAGGSGHLAEYIVERLAGDLLEEGVAASPATPRPGRSSRARCRASIFSKCGTSRHHRRYNAEEAAADLIVDPPRGHLLERAADHVQGGGVAQALVEPQEQTKFERMGELGRGTEAAVGGIEGAA